MSTENSDEKLKILALHGYRQDGETFRQKTGSFRKIVQKWAQFTYITAPHKVIIENNRKEEISDVTNSSDEEQYGWWFNKQNNSFRGTVKGGPAVGFEESLILVENAFKEFGPFDGILGFSQGACFTGILCAMQQQGLMSEELRDIFEDPLTVIHPGKHYVPASAPQKQPYQNFIKKMALHKQLTSV